MAFLRRHFLWLLVALALVAEGGLTFVLMGKKADATAKRKDFEQKQRELLRYQKDPPGRPAVLQTLAERQEATKRELSDSLLFLWHKGRALEPLFADERLQEINVTPWTDRTALNMDFGVFKLLYQNIYDAEVEKLAPKLEALHINRDTLGLAPPNFFTLTGITIGDIFAAQKKFWIIKELVDICAEADIPNLAQVQVLPGKRQRVPAARRDTEEQEAALAKPISVRLVVRCPYPKLSGVLDGLHGSPMGFRLVSVRSVQRAEGFAGGGEGSGTSAAPPVTDYTPRPRRPSRGGSRERAAEGAAAAPVAAPTPRRPTPTPPRPEPRLPEARRTAPAGRGEEEAEPVLQLVQAMVDAEVPDFQLEINQVAFTGAGFGSKDEVKAWLTDQIAAAEAILAQKENGQRPAWVQEALSKLPRPEAGPAEAGEEKEEAPKEPITLVAYPGKTFEREYKVTDPELARQWLLNASAYWDTRVQAVKALCERALKGLDERAVSSRDGVTVTFRPPDHFHKDRFYDQQLTVDLKKPGAAGAASRPRTLGIKFGLLKFSPRLSQQGQNLWEGRF
jgi:hypothetical protein